MKSFRKTSSGLTQRSLFLSFESNFAFSSFIVLSNQENRAKIIFFLFPGMALEHIVRTMVAGSQNTDRAATSSRFSFIDDDDDGDDDEDDGAAQPSRSEAKELRIRRSSDFGSLSKSCPIKKYQLLSLIAINRKKHCLTSTYGYYRNPLFDRRFPCFTPFCFFTV